jgi:hypothetical protein
LPIKIWRKEIPRKLTALMLLNSGLTMLSEPQNEEDFDTTVETPPLTACALKNSFQFAHDFIVVGHSMDRCQKPKYEMKAAMVPYYDV